MLGRHKPVTAASRSLTVTMVSTSRWMVPNVIVSDRLPPRRLPIAPGTISPKLPARSFGMRRCLNLDPTTVQAALTFCDGRHPGDQAAPPWDARARPCRRRPRISSATVNAPAMTSASLCGKMNATSVAGNALASFSTPSVAARRGRSAVSWPSAACGASTGVNTVRKSKISTSGRQRCHVAGPSFATEVLNGGSAAFEPGNDRVEGAARFERVRELYRFELERHIGAGEIRQPRRANERRPPHVRRNSPPRAEHLEKCHRTVVVVQAFRPAS